MTNERTIFIEGDTGFDEEDEFKKLIEETELESTSLQLPKEYLSVSQVGMYMRCGMQFYFRYVKGMIRPPGIELVEGSCIHRALELGLRTKKDTGKAAPLDTMKDVWFDTWKEKKKEIGDWGDDGKNEATRLVEQRGPQLLSLYHSQNMPNIQPIEVEHRFWTMVGKHRIPMIGYIDLVEPTTVVDHKVISKKKSESDVKNDLQLSLYSMVRHMPKVRFDCFVKTKAPKIVQVEAMRTLADYKWMGNVFDKVAEAINAGIFLPCDPASWVCTPKFCGYYNNGCRSGSK